MLLSHDVTSFAWLVARVSACATEPCGPRKEPGRPARPHCTLACGEAATRRPRPSRSRIEAVDHEERRRGPLRPPTCADLLLGCGDEDGRAGAVWRGRVGDGRDEGELAEAVQPLLA